MTSPSRRDLMKAIWGIDLPPDEPARNELDIPALRAEWDRQRRDMEAISGSDLPYSEFPYEPGLELLESRIITHWETLTDTTIAEQCRADITAMDDWGNRVLALRMLKTAYLTGGHTSPAEIIVRLERESIFHWKQEAAAIHAEVSPASPDG